MSAVEVFQNTEFQLRITPTGDTFTVDAPGLSRALGFREGSDLVRTLPDDEKGVHTVHTPGGDQRVWYVTEPGFYRAIGQRQAARIKDAAIREQVTRFQSWVYSDVLPTIRRTGRYEVARRAELPPTYAAALRELADTVEQRDTAQAALAVAEPKAEAWDVLASAHGDYSVREAAAMLCRAGIDTGQNRLFAVLREWGLIDRADRPYAPHLRHVVLRPRSYKHPLTGEDRITSQVRITADGLRYIYRRLTGKQLPVVAS